MIKIDVPSISVAIPTYNRPRSLIRLLDSLNHQLMIDLRDVSVCVVDDGSDIDLSGLFPEYHFDFTYIYRERRSDGLAQEASSRNIAASRTHGDIIMHLDDDLSCHSRVLSEIQNYASLFWMFGSRNWLWTSRLSNFRDREEECKDFSRGPDGYWRDGKARWQFAQWNQCSTAGMVVPRDIWDTLGGLDEDFDGSIGACDQEFSFRAQENGASLYIAPMFFHIDDSESGGSWRDVMIERSGIHNESIFKAKHPELF